MSLERPVYDTENISEYVRVGAYTDCSVSLEHADASKGEAIRSLLLAQAEVLQYPEDAVNYYAEQEKQACRHYAKQNDLSYEDAMEALGLSEEKIQKKSPGDGQRGSCI